VRFGLGPAEVVAALRIPLPTSADQEPAFLQDLAAFLIANRIPAGVRVTLGVPRGEFIQRRFETPPVKLRSLPELVGFEMDRHLPGRREDFLCGWRVEGRAAGGGHAVRLGAVRKTAVERSIALLRRANLAPASIQPLTYALADLIGRHSREKRDVLLIDLGYDSVGLDFIKNGRPEFSRIVPVDDPQWRDSFTVSAASGEAGNESDSGSMRQAAAQRLGAGLAERLVSPLFLESLPGGALPELRIAGYGANRSHLLEKLQNELRIPVRAFSPWPHVRWGNAPADQTPYTSALALAFIGDRGKGAGLELDPERQEELHRAPSLRLTATLASLIAAVLVTHLGAYGLQQRRQLALFDEEISRLKAKMTEVEAVNRRVQEQRARLAYLTATVRGRARQAEILRELTMLLPDTAYLSELTFRDRTVEITGHAPSASQLLPAIEASPLFSGVEFSAPIVAQGAGLERFRIRMRLEASGA
jgi:Tfp pilus assembly protein PilN/Tfp pilus assembly PilM family ATPase